MNKWVGTVIGAIIAAVIASLIVEHYFTKPSPDVSVSGPSTAYYGQYFELNGDVGTGYKTAFWTAPSGQIIYVTGGGSLTNWNFQCTIVGQITISLTVVSDSGATAQASHNVSCVTG